MSRVCTILATILLAVATWQLAAGEATDRGDVPARPGSQSPVPPLPRAMPEPNDNRTTPEKAALGKRLFFDVRLSGDGSMSCATCHDPDKAFGDGLAKARGAGGKELARNTPSLLNVALHERLFWDGRGKSLEQQALLPIQAADEMNHDLDALVAALAADEEYVAQFQAAFDSGVSGETIAQALAAYQRTLVSGRSPFDRYLAGDRRAISPLAREGWELFRGEAGCIQCHHGPLLSDGEFYRLGIGGKDTGRGAVTGLRQDRYKFRTPSLRDVSRTAPYMHDGSLQTLHDVVEFYFRTAPLTGPEGLPLDIEPLLGNSYSQIDAVVAFLESLTGEPEEAEKENETPGVPQSGPRDKQEGEG